MTEKRNPRASDQPTPAPDPRIALPADTTWNLPFETEELRRQLNTFLTHHWDDPQTQETVAIGSYKWGVYAFYDYDGEPIYVGQTNEKLSTRIRRHLTNHRTDAVAMSVLDPYEVCYIEVWPLPQLKDVTAAVAKEMLNAMEYAAFQLLLRQSRFKAVLNEKEPAAPSKKQKLPPSYRAKVVSDEVSKLRDHPDLRIARRAMTLARLAKVIAERKVQKGLRKTLLTQAKRLVDLAERRVSSAPNGPADEDEESDDA
jgi:hypothetical protein